MQVLGQMHHGVTDARARLPAAAHPGVRRRALPPEVGEPGLLLRVGDDDEVPVLGVARGGRLLRELQALQDYLLRNRARQVEPLADRPRRREQLVVR